MDLAVVVVDEPVVVLHHLFDPPQPLLERLFRIDDSLPESVRPPFEEVDLLMKPEVAQLGVEKGSLLHFSDNQLFEQAVFLFLLGLFLEGVLLLQLSKLSLGHVEREVGAERFGVSFLCLLHRPRRLRSRASHGRFRFQGSGGRHSGVLARGIVWHFYLRNELHSLLLRFFSRQLVCFGPFRGGLTAELLARLAIDALPALRRLAVRA
mmetsp:Transcript_6774/g.10899  ORF Transcript_6774/g.10899 Transcript_6774/m.10899 type:complete len:208 (-) Transcript_6774:385-1008(-)